jgi:hypothetical protein
VALRRPQIVFLVVLLLAAAGILVLALRNRTAPFLPDDAEHHAALDPDRCLTCHGRGGPAPQSERHPVGRDCERCHAARRRI